MAFTHLQHRYARALQEYLGNPLECTLRNAQILGSEAHAEGLTVTQMNAIPQQAIHDILPGLLNEAKTPVEKGRRQRSDIEIVSDTHASAAQNGSPSALSPAETFFAETMSSFDAGIRDARESLAALGHQKSAFENRSRRVGREICDCTQQTLALIHLELDKLGPTFSPDGDSPLTSILELLEQVDSQLAGFSLELWPTKILEHLGLVPAIEFMAKRTAEANGIPIGVDCPHLPRLTPSIAIVFFNAVGEALTNIVRHSGATLAHVRLEEKAGAISCKVWDNGAGFEPSEVLDARGERGVGLIAIRREVQAAGGTFSIQSGRGCGTELTLSFPAVENTAYGQFRA